MTDISPAAWLTIIGIGEDGMDGLLPPARAALGAAEWVIGPPRHLALLPALTCPRIVWPVPFREGIDRLLELRGQRVVMLASGDPFWFGAGSSATALLAPDEWIAHPAPSTFTLAASRLGWALQDTVCLGLHAAPLERMRPHLAPGRRVLALLRDGGVVAQVLALLERLGFGASRLHLLEALGGPRERVRCVEAQALSPGEIAHPVAIGIEVAGGGPAMPCTSGLPDTFFASDGQITKRAVRALTLSALMPRPGEMLWDIGAGSGSVAIEWLLAHPHTRAVAIEANPARAARARRNAIDLGVDRLEVIEGRVPEALPQGARPDAVFIGGGLDDTLLDVLWEQLGKGVRLVANAVTLESEALLARWHGRVGGELLRIELADAALLGSRTGWKARYPIVQWSVTL